MQTRLGDETRLQHAGSKTADDRNQRGNDAVDLLGLAGQLVIWKWQVGTLQLISDWEEAQATMGSIFKA